jgi:hypothetical protein
MVMPPWTTAGLVRLRRAEEPAVPEENMSHRAPWPHNRAAGPGESLTHPALPPKSLPRQSLPHRTPGASGPGWAEPAGRPAFLEYIRLEGPELAGETELPPPPEVLDRVLDALRKLT